MSGHVAAVVVRSTTEPIVFRGICQVCNWATHPGGTTEHGARAAALAHVEAAHGCRLVVFEPADEREA